MQRNLLEQRFTGWGFAIEGINVNVRSAFTVAFTFRSAFLALNAAANACERESMRGCARGVR